MSLERAHALTAWVATIALLATPLVRERGRRIVAASVAFASVVITSGLGVLLEPTYRARVRPPLFVASPALGWAFERKQHLAFAAVLLAGSALCALVLARRRADDVIGEHLAGSARIAWTASIVFALVATAVSTVVARRVDALPGAPLVVHDASDAPVALP